MTELARVEQQRMVLTPLTGELVLLDSPTDQLADWLHRIRTAEGDIRDAKRAVTTELLARMDRRAQWTAEVSGWKLTSVSPNATEYDAEGLAAELERLAGEGVIDADLVDAAIKIETTYSVKKAGVNRLKKLGGTVAELVARFERTVPRESRNVRVESR